jgi:predicted nucleotidyltransferase component of viral defense system
MNINKHKYFMLQILKDIFSDMELSNYLGFKGGTALMFFHKLPRFSVDLDFDLIDSEKEDIVFPKLRNLLQKYGSIDDEAKKIFGLILVLDYSKGERKLKIEVSNRSFDNQYELLNYNGINICVLSISDMFAHKLCAMLDRREIANRDIFDCWFFLENRTPINKTIVESRMNTSLEEYIQQCITYLENLPNKNLLNGLGELMDDNMKTFVRNKLKKEIIILLKVFKEFPIIAE